MTVSTGATGPVNLTQSTGSSTTAVMSQDAVTKLFNSLKSKPVPTSLQLINGFIEDNEGGTINRLNQYYKTIDGVVHVDFSITTDDGAPIAKPLSVFTQLPDGYRPPVSLYGPAIAERQGEYNQFEIITIGLDSAGSIIVIKPIDFETSRIRGSICFLSK